MYIYLSTSCREDTLWWREALEEIGDIITNTNPEGRNHTLAEQEADIRASDMLLFVMGDELLVGLALGLGKKVSVVGKVAFQHPKIRYYDDFVTYIKGIES